MRLRVSFEAWTQKMLVALALAPIVSCGGSVDVPTGSAGSTGGTSTGGTSTGGTSTGSGMTPPACQGAAPVVVAGKATGYETCQPGGWMHRPHIMDCPSTLPRPTQCPLAGGDAGPPGECTFDADCKVKPNGFCTPGYGFPGCYCDYGCTTDAECGAGQVCLCGDPVGRCAIAACKSDADCGGVLCSSYTDNPGCGGAAFACQTPADTCASDANCAQGEMCTLANGARVCQSPICAIGRPFLVDGAARIAAIAARGDWCAAGVVPCTDGLSATRRAELAAHWTEVGLMEHASVAAFARFVLQLLSVGAPPALVRDAQAAMTDETRHAEVTFALASAYAGQGRGPGPLSLVGALDAGDPRAILVTAIHEGCVGETAAAIEAAEAAEHAVDPVVRGALTAIAADESRHAELAFRYVRWALARDPALVEVASAAFAAALANGPAEPALSGAGDAALLASGVVGASLRREIRRRALAEVVAPCARALLADVAHTRPSGAHRHAAGDLRRRLPAPAGRP